MKTPSDKSIVFTFASHPTKDPEQRWTAALTFPAGAGPETPLPIELVDGNGKAIAEGTFEMAGAQLPVKAGATQIKYADFIRGKHEVALWLYRPGMWPIPGGLTFA